MKERLVSLLREGSALEREAADTIETLLARLELSSDGTAQSDVESLIRALLEYSPDDQDRVAAALASNLGMELVGASSLDEEAEDGRPPALRPLRVRWCASDPFSVQYDARQRSEGDVVGFLNEGRTHGPCAVVLLGRRLVLAPLYASLEVVK